MMRPVRHLLLRRWLAAGGAVLAWAGGPAVQAQPVAASAPVAAWPLFAVQIRTGPAWEPQKPPQAQAHFQAHSAHLKRLREVGQLLMGARYADVGLLVLAAPDEAQARATMSADPSMQAGVFRFELHPMSVFYPGLVPGRGRADPAP
jgi:uncharacterized protein YciI